MTPTHSRPQSHSQRGTAVIMAMLIVTLAASVAAFAIWQQSLWTRQMENLSDRAQADALAFAGVEWARGILADNDQYTRISKSDAGATIPQFPFEGATLSGTLADMQGRFNINNLASGTPNRDKHIRALERLLDLLKLDKTIATEIAGWMDSDTTSSTDLYYLGLDPPYRSARQRIVDVSELARVKGVDGETLNRLAPFIIALPCITANPCESALNVNTAPPEVIAAAMHVSLSQAKVIVEQRKSKPKGWFEDPSDVTLPPPQTPTAADRESYRVDSDFFLAGVRVSAGRVQANYSALLARAPGSGTPGSNWQGIIWIKEAVD
jgi:general secretion pathway protein K